MPYQAKDNKGTKDAASEVASNVASNVTTNASIKPGPKTNKPVAALLGGFKKS
jgi:hypothetical protein